MKKSNMADPKAIFHYCLGCLSHADDKPLQAYNFQTEALKALTQVDSWQFCYICKRIAQNCEQFIQHVQSNQIYLENFKIIEDSSIESKHQSQPLINLSTITLDAIELDNDNDESEKPVFVVYAPRKSNGVEVKLEFKQEQALEHLDGEFIDDNSEINFMNK